MLKLGSPFSFDNTAVILWITLLCETVVYTFQSKTKIHFLSSPRSLSVYWRFVILRTYGMISRLSNLNWNPAIQSGDTYESTCWVEPRSPSCCLYVTDATFPVSAVNQIIKHPRWDLGRIHPPKSETQCLDFLPHTPGAGELNTKDIKTSISRLFFFSSSTVISSAGIKVIGLHLQVKMGKMFRVRRFLKQQSNMKFGLVLHLGCCIKSEELD